MPRSNPCPRFGAAACIAIVLGGLAPALGRAAADPRVGAEVTETLSAAGVARVVIAFDPAHDASAGDPTDRSTRRAAVQRAADRLLGRMPAGAFTLERRFAFVPALAGLIDARGLAALVADAAVLRVDLDVEGRGSLAEAIPLATVDQVHDAGFTGRGVVAAIIDSGIDTAHPDFAGAVVGEHCFCRGLVGCCPNGADEQDGPGSGLDAHGHGTNVAGIVGSRGTVAPRGAAPETQLVSVRVLDENNNSCCASDWVAGIDWVADQHPEVSIVNMSLQTGLLLLGECDEANALSLAFSAAVATLREQGATLFACSGNYGSGTRMPLPACIADVVSVGAVWDADQGPQDFLGCAEPATAPDLVTCFSDSNATTDLFAPGAFTTSTGLGGGTSRFGGTSQASPLAAGCAATLLQAVPGLGPDALLDAIVTSPVGVTDATNGLTFPRLDCRAALASVWIFSSGFEDGTHDTWPGTEGVR